ncbi:MAG: ABC transporter ATP-binding protein [Nitrospirae bacterium]|nr:MAG: ABC transporter ATP-binding protein [Nitrospirota bacterium]
MTQFIKIENLQKSFFTPAGELRVLKGIDTEFQKGEMVSIVGASGAGKSTFLHILGTLDKPSSGKVTYSLEERGPVDPFSFDAQRLSSFRNKTAGFVFQFHYLLPEFTALENAMMPGLIAKTDIGFLKDKAMGLFSELGISGRKDHKPGELSGGEQQRVAVARALLLDPAVVFADEPTGNLDTATGEELFRLLLDINNKKGVTFLIVTHNESLSKRCNRTLLMADGMLAEKS